MKKFHIFAKEFLEPYKWPLLYRRVFIVTSPVSFPLWVVSVGLLFIYYGLILPFWERRPDDR